MNTRVLRIIALLGVYTVTLNPAIAQQGKSAAKSSFDAVFTEWKKCLEDMRMLQAKAETTEDSELPALKEKYATIIARGEAMIPKLRDAAIAVYKEAPNGDKQITRWLSTISNDYVAADRFDDALPSINALLDGKSDDPVIYNLAGVVAFAKHDFRSANEYFAKAAASGVLTGQSQAMMLEIGNYINYWEREKELIEKAESSESGQMLPHVKMETSKGTVMLELFEDEAPETVSNFVSLVEKGFYDGLTFHRVIGGFMAQGGCPDGDGRGGPGYKIYCECGRGDHRKHFTGSLSMAHAGRDTGGSQFFITFVPTPQLNGKHTAFGRVVEGLEVLAKLQRRDPDKSGDLAIQPDTIVKAEVLRKRDHKYVPNKVK